MYKSESWSPSWKDENLLLTIELERFTFGAKLVESEELWFDQVDAPSK